MPVRLVGPVCVMSDILPDTPRWRGSAQAALVLALGLAALLATGLDAGRLVSTRDPARERGHALAARLQLTDLALFNEARYARHLSQSDRNAAFQDHPMALEHFPAGSLAGPPRHAEKGDARLD